MTGGLLQLVAHGAQDVYLTGNPEITFFKMVYRRYTNFAKECIEIKPHNYFAFDRKMTFVLPRVGDLVQDIYIKVVLDEVVLDDDEKFAWTPFIGLGMIEYIEAEMGGSLIEKQFGDWLMIWLSLARKSGKNRGTAKILGFDPLISIYNNKTKPKYTLYIGLPIFYHSIPIIALQYHEFKIHVKLRKVPDVIIANKPFIDNKLKSVGIYDGTLLVDYIYLNSEERRAKAQTGMEALIKQRQFDAFSIGVDVLSSLK